MLKPHGHGQYIGELPRGMEAEHDTATCNHCNRVIIIKAMCDPADVGGLCKMCNNFICPACVGQGCTPFEEKLKQMEMRDVERRRSYGG
jgi:hypothetical protein